MFKAIQESANYIAQRCHFKPDIAIILGSGLGGLADDIEIVQAFDYQEIPNFPPVTVATHSGKLLLGRLAGKNVVVMQGRIHYYEGYSMHEVVFPVRVMKLLGAHTLLVSNAAGALNRAYQLSDIMLINDHLNFFPDNPLRGRNIDELGERFPDMSEPYDLDLVAKARNICIKNGFYVHEGVYVGVSGPNLETRAEYRMFTQLGADVVGMSTIPEVLAARHAKMRVFGVSVITDLCSEGNLKVMTFEKVLAAAYAAEPHLNLLFKELVKII